METLGVGSRGLPAGGSGGTRAYLEVRVQATGWGVEAYLEVAAKALGCLKIP